MEYSIWCTPFLTGSQNVYQGDLKLILGLVWTLIQKYQLRMKGKIIISNLSSIVNIIIYSGSMQLNSELPF